MRAVAILCATLLGLLLGVVTGSGLVLLAFLALESAGAFARGDGMSGFNELLFFGVGAGLTGAILGAIWGGRAARAYLARRG